MNTSSPRILYANEEFKVPLAELFKTDKEIIEQITDEQRYTHIHSVAQKRRQVMVANVILSLRGTRDETYHTNIVDLDIIRSVKSVSDLIDQVLEYGHLVW